MALDTGLAFKFMQLNYKYGLLDEVGSIVGEALDNVMAEKGMDMEDVVNLLDGASEDTIAKIDTLLLKWGNLFLKLAVNDTMTRFQAYLIRKPAVRRLAVRAATAVLRKRIVMPSPRVPSVEGAAP
jgi:hypothetical protein